MSPRSAPDPVRVTGGVVRGSWTRGDGIALFSGIPYAAPPVGALRWRAPEPARPWAGVREATQPGPRCPQDTSGTHHFLKLLARGMGLGWAKQQIVGLVAHFSSPPQSEDCLSLSVRTGNLGGRGLQPVMVWIHGGAFVGGAGSDELYQSDALVERGVVLVTLNYRLGPLGFLAHPALSAEDPHGSSGNYGLLDQIAALRWVRDNIGAFGGDRDNVTIFGESAGSMSIAFLLASPLAEGLFHRAILQSGVAAHYDRRLDEPGRSGVSAEEAGIELVARAGLTDATAAQLRQLPAHELLTTLREHPELAWHAEIGPVVDGHAVPVPIGQAIARGSLAGVPLLTGYNADEGTLLHPFLRSPTVWLPPGSGADTAHLEPIFGPLTEPLISAYGLSDPRAAEAAAVSMLGDDLFGVQHRWLARNHAGRQHPTYLYHFTREPPSHRQTAGAFHAAEIPFVFGKHDGFLFVADDGDRELTDAILGYWSQFARTGDPNGPGRPSWPRYDPEVDPWQILDRTITTTHGVRRERLDLLEEVLVRRLQRAGAAP